MLLSAAAAADAGCSERTPADGFRSLLDRARADLIAGKGEANEQLTDLMDRLTCVDGPLFEDDLSDLYLAYAVGIYGDDKRRALDVLSWAAALGASWPEDYGGSSVGGVYRELMTVAGAPAILSIATAGDSDVMVMDGWVVEPGEHRVTAGAHLLQWRADGRWDADWVVVEKEQRVSVGPAPASLPRARSDAESPTYGEVTAGMRVYRGRVYDGYREWDGNGITPGLRAAGHLGITGPWFFSGEAALGSGASGDRPPMLSGASALGGATFGGDAWLELGLGPRGLALPGVEPGVPEDDAPVFQESWRLGLQGHLGLGALDGPVSAELNLNGTWFGPAWEAGASLTGGLRFDVFEPIVRLSTGFIGVDAAWGRQSRYDWYSVELGARWRLP